MNTVEKSHLALNDVLYSFSMEERPVSADLLDEYAKKYPEYADALTEFAVEITLESYIGNPTKPNPQVECADPLKIPEVTRAMSKFKYQFDAVRLKAALQKEHTTNAQSVENPFSTLDRACIQSVATQLSVNIPFIIKLRDRAILAETIPVEFLKRIAAALKADVARIRAHLTAAPSLNPGLAFKATGKPSATSQQSFKDAVLSSGLTESQQRDLLSLLR
jgi:hypothetical protein